MEEVRCIKCGRPLRDPDSIARGMGPACAGVNGSRSQGYRTKARSHGKSCYATTIHGSAATARLFPLVEESQNIEEQPLVEEASHRKSILAEIFTQFPSDLIDLVLSAPGPGAISWQIKKYSKKKKSQGWMPPARSLQEIRQMCIDLRLTFFPGMSTTQGAQIACVPDGEDGWRFENSEKVMNRKELEDYLSRYGMIRLASL